MVSPREILDIVELAFYAPALLLAVYVVFKHGHGRQLGWIYLAVLAVIRIVGGSTGIVVISHPSQGLTEATTIASTIGLSPLLLAMLGLLKRVNETMQGRGIRPRLLSLIQIPTILALVLAIIGGTKSFNSDPNTVSTGEKLSEVAVVVFVLILMILTAVTVVTMTRLTHISQGETRIIFAVACSIPFLFVRVLFSLIAAFDHNSTTFSVTATDQKAVDVEAFMATLEEFCTVILYLVAGLAAPKIERAMVLQGARKDAYGKGQPLGPMNDPMPQQGP